MDVIGLIRSGAFYSGAFNVTGHFVVPQSFLHNMSKLSFSGPNAI